MRERLDFPSPLEDNEAWYLPSEQIPSSPTADLVFIKKEAEEFYQRGFADMLAANLYSKHDETFHLGLKFMSHPLAGCYLPIYVFFFSFSRSPCVLCSCTLKHIFTRAAVTEGQETWGCTVMGLHFMSGALPVSKGYESKSIWLSDCPWCLWGCRLSRRATVTLVGWLALIKTTNVGVCTAVRTNPITPAAFMFTLDAHFLSSSLLEFASC